MKKVILIIVAIFTLQIGFSQNGEIISEENGVTVLKVWGTHAERGYAQGYYLAQQIADLWGYYINGTHYSSNYTQAKSILTTTGNFNIPAEYVVEAQNVMLGIAAAGVDVTGLDEWDLLLMSSFLDVDGILYTNKSKGPGCSTLISWDSATQSTDLGGKSIATRFTDWGAYTGVIGNDCIVIHIPSETDEQPWVNVGYAGIIAPLSGMNQGGLGVFGQILLSSGSDHGQGVTGQNYEPTWFTIRKALEKADYNNDGVNDVNDIKDANLSNTNGYADGFIYTSVSKYTSDDRTALIAEMAAAVPYMTHRTNAFDDQIPGDNLYSANDQIKRNNNLDYCIRYNSVINNIGTGENWTPQSHWDFMINYSNSWTLMQWDNIQMMQYIPSDQILKYAGYTGSTQAHNAATLTLDLDTIFPATTTACADDANIYTFTYSGKNYEIIKEKKNWNDAAACAVERGGFLAEINSLAEQNAIYDAIVNGAGVSNTYTTINNGGGIAYVWIGATDNNTEGTWLWDGNNDASGTNFWTGQGSNGSGNGTAVSGAYYNWGGTSTGTVNEPDNYGAGQHHAAIALAGWPSGSTNLGIASEWNDIIGSSELYYVIEYSTTTSSTNINNKDVKIYPNPTNAIFKIDTNIKTYNVVVKDINGKIVFTDTGNKTNLINISDVDNGVYFVNIINKENRIITKKIVKY